MNRTTAIILTIASGLLCGLPGLGLICFGALGAVGFNTPGFFDQHPGATAQQGWLGVGIFVCFGILLLAIPTLIGIFSFMMSKRQMPPIEQ